MNRLTKELLYTAITRGKQKVTLVAEENMIRAVIAKRVQRDSGLAKRLQQSMRIAEID
jgi:exodeoxyribonuclease V alpha subunit